VFCAKNICSVNIFYPFYYLSWYFSLDVFSNRKDGRQPKLRIFFSWLRKRSESATQKLPTTGPVVVPIRWLWFLSKCYRTRAPNNCEMTDHGRLSRTASCRRLTRCRRRILQSGSVCAFVCASVYIIIYNMSRFIYTTLYYYHTLCVCTKSQRRTLTRAHSSVRTIGHYLQLSDSHCRWRCYLPAEVGREIL